MWWRVRIEADIPLTLADVDKQILTRVMHEAGEFQDHLVESFDVQIIGEGVGFLGKSRV